MFHSCYTLLTVNAFGKSTLPTNKSNICWILYYDGTLSRAFSNNNDNLPPLPPLKNEDYS